MAEAKQNKIQQIDGTSVQVYNEQSCLLVEKRMRRKYQKAIDDVQEQIDKFYKNYADKNGVSMEAARQLVPAKTSEDVRQLAKEYSDLLNSEKIASGTQQRLNEIANKLRLTRLDMLKTNCELQMARLAVDTIKEKEYLSDIVYKDAYGHTMFNLQKLLGFV